MSEPFGPFRHDCDPVERVAQLRVLRTLARVYAYGDWKLDAALHGVELGVLGPEHGLDQLDRTPATIRRRILSTFAFIHKPLYSSAREQPQKGTANAYVE